MQRLAVLLVAIAASNLSNDAAPQDKAKAIKGTFTVHVRRLTEPEKIYQKQIANADTVVNAIESLKLPLEEILGMDLWLARAQSDGKRAMLVVDFAAIVKEGRTRTNFLIVPGDRLFLQTRVPK